MQVIWAYDLRTMIDPLIPSHRQIQGVSTVNMPHLVLASGSPRRAQILVEAGLEVDIRPTDTPEHRLPGDGTPELWALRLASDKAARAAQDTPDAVTLGADTMVVIDGEVLGKPSGLKEAEATLRRLCNRPHRVITAVALDTQTGKWSGWSSTYVQIRDLSDTEIAEYVSSGLPLDKAGSYGIQDQPFNPADLLKGCYLNVVGLPLCLTGQLFDLAGLNLDLECGDCSNPMNTVTVQS